MANDINMVCEVGNLTRDIEITTLPNGTAKGEVSIAVNRSRKQGEQWIDEASFFDVLIWGKTAQNLQPYLTKGKKIGVSGYLKQDRWKDQQGNNRSRVYIVAENIQLVGGQNGNTNGNNQQSNAYNPSAVQQQQNYQQAQNTQQYSQQYSQQPSMSGFNEDIPWG